MGMKFQDSTTVANTGIANVVGNTSNSYGKNWDSSATSGASGVTLSCYGWGYCTALVTITYPSGTTSSGACTFEGYDNYNWFGIIPSSQINSATAPSATTFTFASASGATGFFCNINCFSQFRVRLSTTLGGSSPVVNININASGATSNSV